MRKLFLLTALVSAPALACQLRFDYPDDRYQPDRFLLWLNHAADYVAEIPGASRGFDCEDWYQGHLRGRVKVAAEYGAVGSDLYQMVESRAYQYEINPNEAGFIVIGEPFGLRLVQPDIPDGQSE